MKKHTLTGIRTMQRCAVALDNTNDMRPEIRRYLADGMKTEQKTIQALRTELSEAHGRISKAHAIIRMMHDALKRGDSMQWQHRDALELADDLIFEALLCVGTAGDMTS